MKLLRLSFLLVLLLPLAATVQARAATWEYATLERSGPQTNAPVNWHSPTEDISARNLPDLVKRLVAAGHPRLKEVKDFMQLLQALGSAGWELVQVENVHPNSTDQKIYYFKRQTS